MRDAQHLQAHVARGGAAAVPFPRRDGDRHRGVRGAGTGTAGGDRQRDVPDAVDVDRRAAAGAGERRQHRGIAGRCVGRQRELGAERAGRVELRLGARQRPPARGQAEAHVAGSRPVRRSGPFAREADDVNPFAGAHVRALRAHADQGRRNRRLR